MPCGLSWIGFVGFEQDVLATTVVVLCGSACPGGLVCSMRCGCLACDWHGLRFIGNLHMSVELEDLALAARWSVVLCRSMKLFLLVKHKVANASSPYLL